MDEFITNEQTPAALKSFAGLLRSQEPTKVSSLKFLLKKDQETEFTIMPNKDVGDLSSYQGFLDVYQGDNKIFAGWVVNRRR